MSVFVDCLLPGTQRPVRIEAPAGGWTTVVHERAGDVLAAIAGTGPGEVGILLDGRQLAGMVSEERVRHGLGLATSTWDDLPILRVLDVVAVGLRAPQMALWQTVLGTSAARTRNADDEAHVRALAGRVGLSTWIDAPATSLAPDVAALADVTRALAGRPSALLWRRPDWLDDAVQDGIAQAVTDEQGRENFAVIELTTQVR